MSKIEWTEKTWNPIVGCTILSPGCTNCYAMKQAARIARMNKARNGSAGHYHDLTQASKAGPVWTGKVAWAGGDKLLEPLRRKKPTTYFVNSMSDLFQEDVPDEWIDRVFAVMALSPQHTFQVLTKRAKRLREWFETKWQGTPARRLDFGGGEFLNVPAGPETDRHEQVFQACEDIFRIMPQLADPGNAALWNEAGSLRSREFAWPLPNVWLGVSAEDQKRANERVPDMLATPAALRFVSAEPLLGPIVLSNYSSGTTIDWIIVGGESGPGARPMHPDWVRAIRDQCASAGVAFFFKQWGEWAPDAVCGEHLKFADRNPDEELHGWPYDETSDTWRIGKRRAGRDIDGRRHDAMPAVKDPAHI